MIEGSFIFLPDYVTDFREDYLSHNNMALWQKYQPVIFISAINLTEIHNQLPVYGFLELKRSFPQ